MKIKFRVTQLTLFLVILVPVVAALSFAGYLSVRYTGEDLGDQLVDQTSARIEQEIQRIVRAATDQTCLTAHFIEAGHIDVHDFPAVVSHIEQQLKISDESTSMFLALEDTGSCIGISQLHGEPTVWQFKRNVDGSEQLLEEFAIADYPHKADRVDQTLNADMRTRPWYIAAENAGKGAWPDSYIFYGVKGSQNDMGVTYARPIYDREKKLLGVISTDYSLAQLSKYLREMHIGDHGYAFIVELREDGSRSVIAHPNPKILTRDVGGAPKLREVADSPDPVVVGSLAQVNWNSIATGDDVPVKFEVEGVPFMGEVRRIQGKCCPPWLICIVLPEDDILGNVHRVTAISTVLGVTAIAVVILLSMYLASQVAIPLERLAKEAEAIGHLDLASRPLPRSVVLEVDRLSTATDEMKTGLRSFQKYVPPKVVRALLNSNQEAEFGGERRRITILFSDIVGFTTTAEGMPPEELVGHLRRYLTLVSDTIFAAEGTVDKYIGDAVMAFWGAPQEDADHALAACKAALTVKSKLEAAQEEWRREGLPDFSTRFGINTGDVVVGNIGSDTRLSYTAIGDAVNLASRLEGLNKEYGTHIMIAESTREAVGDAIITRPLDFVNVKGKQQAVPVFELVGLRGEVSNEQLELARRSEAALDLFRCRSFETAAVICEEILRRFPNDLPTKRLLERCQAFEQAPPAADWDGAFHALVK